MNAEIITIGDEILIGQTVDTNSAWLGEKFLEIGVRVRQITSIQDKKEHIVKALDETLKRADVIILTGGLGPTKDDITKYTLAEYFNTELVIYKEVLAAIEDYFTKRGREMLQTNIDQAKLPKDCRIIRNYNGTASGMWFEKEGKIIISMPGVPYEMKAMMENEVIPSLKERFNLPTIYKKTVLIQGIGESFIVDRIKDWEEDVEKLNIDLAYLPSPGLVKVRLMATGNDENILNINQKAEELYNRMQPYAFGYNVDSLQQLVGKMLLEKNATLSTAESCTGGNIARLITSVSGSSNYYLGSIVSYANEVKSNELGVDENIIEKHGAVSQQVVEQMAKGILQKLNSDYSIATSGIAGPDGGTEEKPVGTVWIAIADKNSVYSKKFTFGDNRERNIILSSLTALNLLRNKILNKL